MKHPCPEVEEAHSCSFCEEHLALDLSKVNGAISPARLEQMQKRLRQVGVLGETESLYDDKYIKDREILEDYHFFDMSPDMLRSEVANSCPYAAALHIARRRREEDEHHLLTARVWRRKHDTDFVTIGYDAWECKPEASTFLGSLMFTHGSCSWTKWHKHLVLRSTFLAEEGSAAAQEFSRRPMNRYPFEHTLQHARGWLESCLRCHPDSSGAPDYVPKRLLDITQAPDGSSRVTVVDGSTPVSYATLSYKWGGSHEPILTKSRFKGAAASALQFDLEVLPKTIADAVKVAQALGINHLWVDALCIIQDDSEDKAKEVGQMSQIYSKATVAILASRSNSASEGFLHYRYDKEYHENPGKGYPPKLYSRVRYRTIAGEQSSIIITYPNDAFEEGQQPLDTRAWSFQEVLLSPHIISYGTQRTVFDCSYVGPLWTPDADVPLFTDDGGVTWYPNCQTRRELDKARYKTYTGWDHSMNQWGRDFDRPNDESFWDMIDKVDHKGVGKLIDAHFNRQHAEAMGMWYRVLGMYTKRELSDPRDRLNGLAGVAEIFARYLKDEYVAGFWRSDLLAIFTWRLEPVTGNLQQRPADYCGPTWSWASHLNGIVSYEGRRFIDFRWDRNLLILDCQAKPIDDATKFGAVSSGFLKVAGKLLHGTLTSKSQDAVRRYDSRYSVSANWSTQFGPEVDPWLEKLEYEYQPDALEQEFVQDENSIPIVMLILGYKKLHMRCHCLVLRKVAAGLYSRLGSLGIGGDAAYGGKESWIFDKGDMGFSRISPIYGLPCVNEKLWDQAFPVETITII